MVPLFLLNNNMKYIILISGILMILIGTIVVSVPLYTLDTHENITTPIKQILYNDGFQNYSDIISTYESELINGVRDEDNGINSKNHFFNPLTGDGLGGFKSSAILAQEHFSVAVNYWKSGEESLAIYWLGRTLHLIQDSTVPHHAALALLNNHEDYENWLEGSGTLYTTAIHGNYQYDNIYDYIYNNSITSLSYFQYCDGISPDNYPLCGENLIPLAQSSSAGIVVLFFETEGINIQPSMDLGELGLVCIIFGFFLCLVGYFKKR